MLIDWFTLFASVVVLWFPASWMYPAEARDLLSDHRGTRVRVSQFLSTWQHWFDALRGGTATYFLVNFAVRVDPEAASGLRIEVFVIHAAILAIAVVFQTVNFRLVIYCTAPIAFVIGLTFALSNWQAAAFATIFGLCVLKAGSLELKFPVMAVLLGVAGYFIMGTDLYLILNCSLLIFPLILTFIAHSTFVIYSRSILQ